MEPEVEVYCKKDNRKRNCTCLWVITALISTVLAFFIGVLVESLAGLVGTLTLGAVIVLIITLAILLIISIINLICSKTPDKKKKQCCCC